MAGWREWGAFHGALLPFSCTLALNFKFQCTWAPVRVLMMAIMVCLRDRSPISGGVSGQEPADSSAIVTADRPPPAIWARVLALSPYGGYSSTLGETETGDKCGSAPMASAKHLLWYGKVNGRGNPLGLASLDHHWAVAGVDSPHILARED